MTEEQPVEEQPVETEDIMLDEQGRVVVTNPVLAEALRMRLGPEAAARRAQLRPGINVLQCGSGC